uniref:Uncharacterized protein n=1 Tax=Physcomitrium patens TaxID=3218 RepID=A0A2K1IA24_PHYPA|nr:hypothetical protein PHYPA_030701 [Physcomitrium patens]
MKKEWCCVRTAVAEDAEEEEGRVHNQRRWWRWSTVIYDRVCLGLVPLRSDLASKRRSLASSSSSCLHCIGLDSREKGGFG